MDTNNRINELNELNMTSITEILKNIKNVNENRPEEDKLNDEDLKNEKIDLYKNLMTRVKEIIKNNELTQEDSQDYINAIRNTISDDIGEIERDRIANEVGFTNDEIEFAQKTDTEQPEHEEEHDDLEELQTLIDRAKTEEVDQQFWVNFASLIDKIRNSSLSSERGEQFRKIINESEIDKVKYIAAGKAYDSIYNAEELNLSLYELYNENKEVLNNEELRDLEPLSRTKSEGYADADPETQQEADKIIEEYDSKITNVNKEIYDLTKEIEKMEKGEQQEEQTMEEIIKELEELTNNNEEIKEETKKKNESYRGNPEWAENKLAEEELSELKSLIGRNDQNEILIDGINVTNEINKRIEELREKTTRTVFNPEKENLKDYLDNINKMKEELKELEKMKKELGKFSKEQLPSEMQERIQKIVNTKKLRVDELRNKHSISSIDDLDAKLKKAQETLKRIEGESYSNDENYKNHEKRINELREKCISILTQRLETIEEEINKRNKEINDIDKALEALGDDITQSSNKQKLEEQKQKSKQKLQEIEAEKKEIEEIINELKKEPFEIKEDLKEKLNKYKGLSGKGKEKKQEDIDKKKAELETKKEERKKLIAEKKQKLSELFGRTRGPEDPEQSKSKNEKLWLKAALGLGGFALGFGLSTVTGVGKIRMGIAIVKLTTSAIDKVSGGAITKISNRFTENLKENHPKIAAGIERINSVLQSGYFQWFVNGVSAGYIAGNVIELLKASGLFHIPNPNPTPGGGGLQVGQGYDLSNIPRGYTNSFTDKSVKIMNDTVGKNVTFDKINNGYAHFIQPDGKGYAWIKLDELQQYAPEIFGEITKTR